MPKLKMGLILSLFQGCLLGFLPAQSQDATTQSPNALKWSSDLPAALKQAELENKMVLEDISPDWSSDLKRLETEDSTDQARLKRAQLITPDQLRPPGSNTGKRMDTEVFTDPTVQKQMTGFILVKIIPKTYEEALKIANQLHYGPGSFPIIRILNGNGGVATQAGYFANTAQFQHFLTEFHREFYSDSPLEPFEVRWNVSSSKCQTYSFNLSEDEISNAPIWAENEASPPLAPGMAIRLAEAKLQEITSNGWDFYSIRLQPIDGKGHWLYRVFFYAKAPPDAIEWLESGGDSVPVLMNGFVPNAELTRVNETKQ